MVRAKDKQGVRILSLTGSLVLDAENAYRFLAEATTLAQGSEQLVLDLANVGFIDSAGLRALISLRRHMLQQGGNIVLARVRDDVREILEVTRLTKVFPVYPDVSSAVRALARPSGLGGESSLCKLEVRVTPVGCGYLLKAEGCDTIDGDNVSDLVRKLAHLSSCACPVVLDLRDVEYIDSTALSSLHKTYHKASQVKARLYLLLSESLAEIVLTQIRDWRGSVLTDENTALALLKSEGEEAAKARPVKLPSARFVDVALLMSKVEKSG